LFFERHDAGERAVLVHLEMNNETESEDKLEFQELVASAGVEAVSLVVAKHVRPNAKYFVGQGKVDEIRILAKKNDADIVLFNHTLSPSQERNLESQFECRVHDRTALILDIFAQRARTHEGKLQVELAQLQYMSTRLVRGWTHLERQKGGIGLRGPGETQLETDRRLLRVRIKNLRARLEKVRKQRDQGRRSRSKAEMPTLSLVGYTNAGKSTLFNALTNANVYVKDQLFATLDPTLRQLDIPEIGPIVLADTVGFIRHLPHKLVEAFRTTLQETSEAALLLHVIDAADENKEANIEQVDLVLSEIKADEVPCLHVYNKIDRLEGCEPRIDRDSEGLPLRVWLSAATGAGLDLLSQAIRERLSQDIVSEDLIISATEGGLRSKFYQQGAVVNETVNEEGDYLLCVRLPRQDLNRLLARR
jgi:GTP-binding protein HflX